MHYTRRSSYLFNQPDVPIYKRIRKTPVIDLLSMNKYTLKRLERQIRKEVFEVKLSLNWILGVQQVKKSLGKDTTERGEQKNG